MAHIVENSIVSRSLRHDSVKDPVPFICCSHRIALQRVSACLKLAALIVTKWLPTAVEATCFPIHIQRQRVLLPAVIVGRQFFGDLLCSAHLKRGTACLCYKLSF